MTCVSYDIPSDSSFTVAPPVITNSGEVYGCPRRLIVGIDAPDKTSTIHFTLDGSTPTVESPQYDGPLPIVLTRKGTELHIRALAVGECGAVSTIAKQDYDCKGTYLTTPTISHWFDFPLPWPGKKPYDDVVFERAELPAGCVVTGIRVQLIGRDGRHIETQPGHPEATDYSSTGVPTSGVSLKSYSVNGRQLELRVNSWHLFGFKVRYLVEYFVRGTNCSLPPFSYRTE